MLKRSVTLTVVVMAALSSGAIAQPASHVDVNAGYLLDTTFIAINNVSHLDFSDAVLQSVGGAFPGESLSFGPLGHQGGGADTTAGLFYAASGAFAGDYDESSSVETFYRVKLIAPTGTFYSGVFSPSLNLSHVYVDFLGLGADNDTDAFPLVATAAVPEPAGWAMMLIGFGALGALTRRRRSHVGCGA